jgi:hypothetical protein
VTWEIRDAKHGRDLYRDGKHVCGIGRGGCCTFGEKTEEQRREDEVSSVMFAVPAQFISANDALFVMREVLGASEAEIHKALKIGAVVLEGDVRRAKQRQDEFRTLAYAWAVATRES